MSVHMSFMTTTATADTATCDKVRDPLKGMGAEYEGKLTWTCIKPANHDNRGPHLMVDAEGRKTQWRGADND